MQPKYQVTARQPAISFYKSFLSHHQQEFLVCAQVLRGYKTI